MSEANTNVAIDQEQDAEMITMTLDRSMVLRVLGATALGMLLVLNQFGSVIDSFVDISLLRPIWQVNELLSWLGYPWLLGLVLVAVYASYELLRVNRAAQHAYRQGVLAGFGLFPVIVLALAAVALAVWLAIWLFRLLGLLVGIVVWPIAWLIANAIIPFLQWVMTPFVWLWDNAFRPVLAFLSWPLFWLLENVLQPVVNFVMIPFIWIADNIVLPLLRGLARYVFLPLAYVVGGIIGILFGLVPFLVIGGIVQSSFREVRWGVLNPQTTFSQGVGLGFVLFDTALLTALAVSGTISPSVSVTTAITLWIPILYVSRLTTNRAVLADASWPLASFANRARVYSRQSGLELAAACVLLPLAVATSWADSDN